MSWHATDEDLASYAVAPERMDTATAASLEAHLLRCEQCRLSVVASADPAFVADSWNAIADIVDRPHRLVDRLAPSVAESSAVRLVVATRSLLLAWLGAVVGTVTVAVWASRVGDSAGPFLAVAPLIPTLLVWLAFSPIADPAGEAGLSTPLHGFGLAIRRVVAVALPALPVVALAAATVPDASITAVVWVLPGVALAAACLALATWVRVTVAAAGVAAVWAAVIVAEWLWTSNDLVDVEVFHRGGQIAALTVAVAGCAVCWTRRSRFSTTEVSW